MARKTKACLAETWSLSELERRDLVEAGGTVVASLRSDAALIAWAQAGGHYVRIDRRTAWGNPFEIDKDGDRATVIESYREYVKRKQSLLSRLTELRGKVLGCWCHPEPCHGCVLIELIQENQIEHDAHRGLHCPRANSA